MNLKSRLLRLGPGPPLSRSEQKSRDAGVTSAVAKAPAPVSVQASDPRESPNDIDVLRAKMNAILGKNPVRPVAPTRFDPSESTLPFCDRVTDHGTLSQRLETQRRSARVGRMSLASAADGDAEMLSLLALNPELSECDFQRAVYFDTETTGLGGSGVVAFLVGLGWFDDDGCFVLEQLLLRSPAEEQALLRRVRELFEAASVLVSFNGKSFDWPLLQSRCVMNRAPELPRRPHLDLLHVSRRIHRHRLERCRLIDLESEVLGWLRGEDDIPGAEIAPRYGHFLRTGDEEALRAVVDHNAWDVFSMAALVGLYGESLERLDGTDLVGVTTTLTRAKAYQQAERAADRALAQGEGSPALEARARLFKARGDKARALADFSRLSQEVDDPRVRLELCKLFEHYEKDFALALRVLEKGTGESVEAVERRRTRLERRQARPPRTPRGRS